MATSAVAPLVDSSFVVGTGRVARAPQQTSPSVKGVNLKVNEDGGNGARKMGFYDGIFLENVLCYVNHLG